MSFRDEITFSTTPISLMTREEYKEKLSDCKGIEQDNVKQLMRNAAKKILDKDNITELTDGMRAPGYVPQPIINKNANSNDFASVEGTCIGYLYYTKTSHSNNHIHTYLVASPVFEYEVDGVLYNAVLGEATSETAVYVNSKAQLLYNIFHPEQAVYDKKHRVVTCNKKLLIATVVTVMLLFILTVTSNSWGKYIPSPNQISGDEEVISVIELDDLVENEEGKLILTDDYLEDLSNNFSHDYYEETDPSCLPVYQAVDSNAGALGMAAFAIAIMVFVILFSRRKNRERKAFSDTFDNTYVDKEVIAKVNKNIRKNTSGIYRLFCFICSIFVIAGVVIFFFAKPGENPDALEGYENVWYITHYYDVSVEKDGSDIILGRDGGYTNYPKETAIYFDKSVSGDCYIVENREGIVNIFPTDSYVYEGDKLVN
ncbi:MAG: hypothetical protein MJ153_05055 [Clostridia bacterium]|nr:hypothetical protein [Clostridia bacterium]